MYVTLKYLPTHQRKLTTLSTPLVYAAISSLSLSLLATGIDSVFDIGSNVLLVWLHKKASKLDANKWPVGGARLETIGNIVYGTFPSNLSHPRTQAHRTSHR